MGTIKILATEEGYDTKQNTAYQSVKLEFEGHIFDISRDKFGIDVMIDERDYKHYNHIRDVQTIIKYISTNKLP